MVQAQHRKRKKTRLQLARKITRMIQPANVRVASITVNADGTWHAITVGKQTDIQRQQPRIEAAVAKIRDGYEIDSSHESVATIWLHWARGRTRPKVRRDLRKKMSSLISGGRRRRRST